MLSLNISKFYTVYKHTNIVGSQYNKYYTINSILTTYCMCLWTVNTIMKCNMYILYHLYPMFIFYILIYTRAQTKLEIL